MFCMRGREKEADLVGGVRIKSTGRLIQKENPRISHQSDANVCPLALPSCIVISYEQCQMSAAVISPFQILALERGGHHSSSLNVTMETNLSCWTLLESQICAIYLICRASWQIQW